MTLARRMVTHVLAGGAAILLLSTLLFVAMDGLGDPLLAVVSAEATEEARAAAAAALGLDDAFAVRLVRHVSGMLSGDFGTSYRLDRPAAAVVTESYPFTLYLAAMALPVGILGGLALALTMTALSIQYRSRKAAMLALVAQAIPGFVVAIVAVQVAAVDWRLVPSSGYSGPVSLVMPSILIGAGLAMRIGLVLHERLMEVWREPYVRFAQAKGIANWPLFHRHMLRPAFSLVLSYASLQLGYLFAGAIVVETVFAYPGIGRLAVSALASRDLPLLNACLVYAAVAFILIRIVADALHTAADPRLSRPA